MDESDAKLRDIFKQFNRFMLWMWRLGFKRWVNALPSVSGRIMVITHTGRRSGIKYRTPLNYAVVDGELYCTAGFGSESDWYRNILVNPQIEVWLPDSRWQATIEDISSSPRRLELLRQVVIASGIVGPLLGVDGSRMSDEDFNNLTHDYRLLHIQRIAALAGPGGPGDLAWVWVPILLLVAIAFFRRRSR